jgi:hypothetical protein
MSGEGAAEQIEWLTEKTEEHQKTIDLANQALDPYIENLRMSGETMEMAAQAMDPYIENLNQATIETEELEQATGDWDANLKELQSFINGKLGPEIENFTQKNEVLKQKIIELQGQIDILESKEYLTAEQQAELDGAQAELLETQGKVTELAAEHDRATKQILLDLLAQRIALLDTKGEYIGVINDIAFSWGLIDEATWTTVNEIDAALVESGGDVDMFRGKVEAIAGAWGIVPTDVYTDYHVHTEYTWSGSTGPGGGYKDPDIPSASSDWTPPTSTACACSEPNPKPEDWNLPQFGSFTSATSSTQF